LGNIGSETAFCTNMSVRAYALFEYTTFSNFQNLTVQFICVNRGRVRSDISGLSIGA
jgi:hypothetical protein